LSPELLNECKKRITGEGLDRLVRFVVADARDLSEVAEKEFDAVLMMGPLYHLIEEADRKVSLKEAFNHLREDGIIFSAFISRFGAMSDMLKDVPGWIENQAEVRSLVENGKRPIDFPRGGFRGYFTQVPEIAPLHETTGFETITVAGMEPIISADDECYNKLEGKQRQQWLDLLYEISTERSIIGLSRHLLYIGKKKG
jgi:S-adenosylmethionine-dependent methyltransferase